MLNGTGVVKDQKEAATWYRKAADKGHSKGQYNLGVCYAEGEGVIKDQKEAATWFSKAADQAHKDAQFNLGVRYPK